MGLLTPQDDESVMLRALISEESRDEPGFLEMLKSKIPKPQYGGGPLSIFGIRDDPGEAERPITDDAIGAGPSPSPPLVPSHGVAEQEAVIQQAKVDEFKRSLGYDPAPEPLSQLDKGIAVAEMPEDKIRRIRAQARMKGAAGSLGAPTPGDIDTAGISAELQPRGLTEVKDLGPYQTTEAMEQYVAGAPYREAISTLTTPEIYGRDPGATDKAQTLLGMGREMRHAQRQKTVDSMIDAVTGISGTVPFEMVQKLTMLDPQSAALIPEEKIGLSRVQVQNQLYKEMETIEELAHALSGQFLISGDDRMQALNKLRAEVMRANQLINSPGADPTQIWNDLMQIQMEIRNKFAPTQAMGAGEEEYTRLD
jgi:hypothetical protein